MFDQIISILFAFLILILSAQETIKRLIFIARTFHISEFAISFILAGIITITPEFSLAINSAFSGVSPFGLGVIFGSNIADLTLIIGIVAIFSNGISLRSGLLDHTPWFIAAVLLPVMFLIDGEINFLEGLMLIIAFIIYLFHMLQAGKSIKDHFKKQKHHNFFPNFLLFLVSFSLVLLTGNYIAEKTTGLSVALSIPVFLLGIVLAIGTCLPELSVALTATKHHHTQLGIGNILGNVFADSMFSIGVVALIQPIRAANHFQALFAGIVMVTSLLLLLYLFKKKKHITRFDGVLLIGFYVLFLVIESLTS